MGIGNNIKEQRIKQGYTQREVAEKLFVTTQAVSRWENNETEPSVDTIKALADLFSISVEVLLGTKSEGFEHFTPKTNLSKKNYLYYFFIWLFVFFMMSVLFLLLGIRTLDISNIIIWSFPMLLCLGFDIFYLRKLIIVSRIKRIEYGKVIGVVISGLFYKTYKISFEGENKVHQQFLITLSKYKYISNEPCAYGVDKKGKGYLIDIHLKD
ncbi:MAG: helix-turn-helix domain-containing protein [Anaeroplasmataceae bacterium]|nr:helix-turn-helix domain-containing protein [Anaeroplasmataceae bacterium]